MDRRGVHLDFTNRPHVREEVKKFNWHKLRESLRKSPLSGAYLQELSTYLDTSTGQHSTTPPLDTPKRPTTTSQQATSESAAAGPASTNNKETPPVLAPPKLPPVLASSGPPRDNPVVHGNQGRARHTERLPSLAETGLLEVRLPVAQRRRPLMFPFFPSNHPEHFLPG
jgi:hypothetical protein